VSRPPARRLIALFVTLAVAFCVIGARLVLLQVHDAQAFASMGERQRTRTIPLPATRGSILDRYGGEMALSLGARAIYADPRYVTDPVGEAAEMAPILEMKPMVIQRLLSSEGGFAYIARQVDQSVADRVEALDLPGIGFLPESRRHYPSGSWGAPQVVGIVGLDDIARGGLELEYDETLAGQDGEQQVEIDPAGRFIPQGVHVVRPAVPGSDVEATIDPELQYQAEVALESAVDGNGAKGGTVVAMDPRTGEVLVLTTYYPTGKHRDPARDRVTNPAVTSVFEPGSVNKVITAAAVIEEDKVSLDEVFHVPDQLTVYDYTIHDAEPHAVERMKLGDIITHSSNVGTILVARQLGSDLMAEYLAKFGYGQETGIGLPGESAGLLPSLYSWSGVSMANLPIGQGVSVTPLQMVNVYATIANGGVWTQPSLVRGTIDPDGVFHPAPPPETRRVVSEETAKTVTSMLAHVVTSGTGTEAQIPGYWVAGKTGTGKVPNPNGSGYINEYVASFIGFLPASDPRIVIGVVIDQPSTQIYGGLVAAPVFKQLGMEAIARLRIPAGKRPDFPPSAMHGR